MDAFGCDYECKTVGEGITKYNLSNDWCVEFDACDGTYPILCIQVEQVRKVPALMNLKLKIVGNPEDEYAGCIVTEAQKTIAFKINDMRDLRKAIERE